MLPSMFLPECCTLVVAANQLAAQDVQSNWYIKAVTHILDQHGDLFAV